MNILSIEQLAKLPLWARKHITELYDEINSLTNSMGCLSRRQQRTNIFFCPDFIKQQNVKVYLPENKHIRYILSEQNYLDIRLDSENNELIIHGNTEINVMPKASNAINIK